VEATGGRSSFPPPRSVVYGPPAGSLTGRNLVTGGPTWRSVLVGARVGDVRSRGTIRDGARTEELRALGALRAQRVQQAADRLVAGLVEGVGTGVHNGSGQ
jgi:hypothetical protein